MCDKSYCNTHPPTDSHSVMELQILHWFHLREIPIISPLDNHVCWRNHLKKIGQIPISVI